MSHYELEPTIHDIHVSLAIRSFLTDWGGEVLFADGGLPFREHTVPVSPVFFGYRPDAMISLRDFVWFVEVKSAEDMTSSHSQRQFSILSALMDKYSFVAFYLLVFGSQSSPDFRSSFFPLFGEFSESGRLIVAYT